MRSLLLTGVSAGAILLGVVAAQAADVRAPVRVVAPAPIADWSGHYFGLSLGWGQAGLADMPRSLREAFAQRSSCL